MTAEERLRAAAIEVGHLRHRDVQNFVAQRLNDVDGNATTAEVEEWERVGYRRWRERWPALNNLLMPHGGVSS